MPRKIEGLTPENAVRLYRETESLAQVAQMLGCSEAAVSANIRRAGTSADEIRRQKSGSKAVRLFKSGASVKAIAKQLGVARGTIVRWLNLAGIEQRDRSEAMRLRMSKASPSARAALTAAAHEAVRGRAKSIAELERRAVGYFRTRCKQGAFERDFAALLDALGRRYSAEHAIERYNIDFMIGRLAVEVCRSKGNPLRRGHFAKKLEYLGDVHIPVLSIWCKPNEPPRLVDAEYAIALANFYDRHPAAKCEHRMIRSRGDLGPFQP